MTIFSGDNFEAIIGLGYAALAEPGVTPAFDEMMSQNVLKNNMFSFSVGSNPEMTLGYYDKSKFKGDIHWNPIDFKYMYGIKLDDIKVNGKNLNICAGQSSCLVTIDSGSSMNAFPEFAHKALQKEHLPAAGYNAPCNSAADFGDMTLVINGKDYIIPNSEWVGSSGLVQSKHKTGFGPQTLVQLDKAENKATDTKVAQDAVNPGCQSNIANISVEKDMFILGLTFMRKYYTIFDRDNDRVGLAEAL